MVGLFTSRRDFLRDRAKRFKCYLRHRSRCLQLLKVSVARPSLKISRKKAGETAREEVRGPSARNQTMRQRGDTELV